MRRREDLMGWIRIISYRHGSRHTSGVYAYKTPYISNKISNFYLENPVTHRISVCFPSFIRHHYT